MSRETVEIARRSLEAFARGDFATAFEAHDPAVEWCTAADEPDQQTYRGITGLHRFVESLEDLWEGRFDDRVDFEDFIDRGDWVVVPWRALMRGRTSGITVEVSETYAVQVHDGKIVRVEEYRHLADALARAR
jgi:ketosteroid isomerase-like protein